MKSNGKDEVVFHIRPIADAYPARFGLYADGDTAALTAFADNPRNLSRKAFDEYGATIVRWDFDLKLAE